MRIKFCVSKIMFSFALVSFSSLYLFGQSQPNIILILTDDMGYADIGYNNNNTDIATPTLDNLASQGTKFTSAYVTHPFCGPSRAGLMTGRYPHEFGSQYNLNDNEFNLGIDTNETYFSTVLQNAGYKTGIIGKWHLGQSTNHDPNARGFDYFYGMLTGGHNFFTKTSANGGFGGAYNRDLVENRGPANEPFNAYITDLFTDKAIDFIQDAETNDAQPFFLFMSYNAPHTPLQALQSDKNALTNGTVANFNYGSDTNRHNYAAMVYSVDRCVKRIVDELALRGETNNTLIVFLSDNGGRTDRGASNAPLRGVKGDTFEGGFRVPMFMYWPDSTNGIPSGQTYNHNVSSLDLYPTFVNLANGTIPNGKEIDGKDILNNVRNNTDARSGESIYSIRHQAVNKVGIRRGEYKAYQNSNDGNWYLFDINANIGEDFSQALNTNIQPYKSILEAMAYDAYQWALTHIEPVFFDSTGAENTWINTHSNTNTSRDTWQDRLFAGYTTLSIEDIEVKNMNGYVFPNPVESSLSVKFSTPVYNKLDITIYDIQGKPVVIYSNLKTNGSTNLEIPLNVDIQKGTYILKVKSEIGSFSKAFIKD